MILLLALMRNFNNDLSSIIEKAVDEVVDEQFDSSRFVQNMTEAIEVEERRALAEMQTRVGALVDRVSVEETKLASAYADAADAQKAATNFERQIQLYTLLALGVSVGAALVINDVAQQLHLPYF